MNFGSTAFRRLVRTPAVSLSVVGCLGFNGPFRQYFSLYRAVSQREGERRERIDKSKNVQTTPTRTYCKRSRPLPYSHPNCRTPRYWKFTQHHRTTWPPPVSLSQRWYFIYIRARQHYFVINIPRFVDLNEEIIHDYLPYSRQTVV